MLLSGLLLATVASAVAVVYAQHRSRELFVELEALSRVRDELNLDWGRLQLEQSAWATHGRVEQLARERLGMRMPAAQDTVTVPR
jgi:cell division protein FtsL